MASREDKELHEQTLSFYLQSVDTLRRIGSSDFPGDPLIQGAEPGKGKETATLLWGQLRRTNIFEFHPEVLTTLTNSFIGQIVNDDPEYAKALVSEAKGTKINIDYHDERLEPLIAKAAKRSVLPENLPFDCLYLGYGSGSTLNSKAMKLDPHPLESKAGQVADHISSKTPCIAAHLVLPNGDVWMLVAYVTDPFEKTSQDITFVPVLERKNGVWLNPNSLAAFIVPWLISYINEHRTIVEERTTSFSYRRTYKGIAKKYKHRAGPPPPYYVIPMELGKVQVYQERHRADSKEIEWTCRRKRRGHERVRVRRGKLPLDHKTEAKLRREWGRAKGDFELFITSAESPRAARALARRGHWPKRPDEWLAVLYTWIDDVVWPKDRPDLPLVEAVRRPRRQPCGPTIRVGQT
jgi:hypothetical protein